GDDVEQAAGGVDRPAVGRFDAVGHAVERPEVEACGIEEHQSVGHGFILARGADAVPVSAAGTGRVFEAGALHQGGAEFEDLDRRAAGGDGEDAGDVIPAAAEVDRGGVVDVHVGRVGAARRIRVAGRGGRELRYPQRRPGLASGGGAGARAVAVGEVVRRGGEADSQGQVEQLAVDGVRAGVDYEVDRHADDAHSGG